MAVIDHHKSHVYKKAKEIIESMEGEEGSILREYVKYQAEHISSLNDRIKEMGEVFRGIRKFTK